MHDLFGLGIALWAGYFITVVPMALFSLALPYAVLRLRSEGPADPQLGTKIGLQYFYSLAIILGLAGLTVMAVDLITRDDILTLGRPMPGMPRQEWFNPAQRTGLGILVSGALLALVHFLMARSLTNKLHWPRVRRLFAGWRFAIAGMVVMFAVTALIIQCLQKDPFEAQAFHSLKMFFAVLAIWVPAWATHLALLRIAGGKPRGFIPPSDPSSGDPGEDGLHG